MNVPALVYRLKGAQFGSVDFSAQSENLGELGCL